jgi:hypothetical protein
MLLLLFEGDEEGLFAEARTADCDWTREGGWKKNGESCPATGDGGSAS